MTEPGPRRPSEAVLILGIGNVLMGDEGVGPAVVSEIQRHALPPGVTCLDGGTGGFTLLGSLQAADRVVLIDACADGGVPGTLRRLRPKFSADYPPTLTAHDIGLKDLLDSLYVLGDSPDITLFAVSIEFPQPMRWGLRRAMQARVSGIARTVLHEVQ